MANRRNNMTPSLNIISARSMLAAGQPETIAAEQTELENVRLTKPAFLTWKLPWHVPTLLEVFVGILVVFYLSAAVALAGALLFYTFKK